MLLKIFLLLSFIFNVGSLPNNEILEPSEDKVKPFDNLEQYYIGHIGKYYDINYILGDRFRRDRDDDIF